VAILQEALILHQRRVKTDLTNNREQSLLAWTHGLIGMAEQARHEYAVAVQAYTKSVEIFEKLDQAGTLKGPFSAGLNSVRQRLSLSQRLADLDARVTVLLKGKTQPKDTAERLALAQFCQDHKKLYAAAACWYHEAFVAEPAIADDLRNSHCYNAACAAALAGCGQGKDAAALDDKEKRRLRDQALAWLRSELELIDKQNKAGDLAARVHMIDWLAHAQKDRNFKGVRESLVTLPESEQAPWRKLWADTDQLLKQARASVSQTTLQGALTDKTLQFPRAAIAGRQGIRDRHDQQRLRYLPETAGPQGESRGRK
jgi:tetratricopeptide (TPR) repeat protein